MPRKNRQLRPKNAAPEPDCRRTATNGGGTSEQPGNSLLSTSNLGSSEESRLMSTHVLVWEVQRS